MTPSKRKYVTYIRVSTARQGASGLGLEAQREAIQNYLNGGNWEVLEEFQEIESGKNNDRPILKEALTHCQLTGATLLVAKLDRLSRDIHFITSLEKAKIKFTVCDFPDANEMTIHLFATLAQYERKLISERTKAALSAKKARGHKLGKPENLSKEAADKGRKLGDASRIRKADEFAAKVKPTIEKYLKEGMSFNQIAQKLNERQIQTARGAGAWTHVSVGNILKRSL